MPSSASAFQQAATSSGLAMSAIEQPASRFGRITCCFGPGQDIGAFGHEVHAAEEHEFGVGRASPLRCESLNESPRKSANWITSSRW